MPSESPWNLNIVASREGRVDGVSRTATGALMTADLLGAALPSTKVLRRNVEIQWQGMSVVVPVLDVGPWFEKDHAYVLHHARPAAESEIIPPDETNPGTRRKSRNPAGIDLFDATVRLFGVEPEQWGLRRVDWRFV